MINQVKAFAPATVANLAVGFDILGHPLCGVGDEIVLKRLDRPGITIEKIDGVATNLPFDPEKNTATVALNKIIKEEKIPFGFSISIKKGIPIGSGMGGSASSAVAAVIAANAFLQKPVDKKKLLQYALAGEFIASGSMHADNVGPCLYGGLVAVSGDGVNTEIIDIPVPKNILCVLIHPHMRIDTKEARAILRTEIGLTEHVKQSSCLAAFIAGCFKNDLNLIRRSMKDLIVGPQRSKLIPGFKEAGLVASANNALGFSISGSGPSVFAWAESMEQAKKIEAELISVFKNNKIEADSWVCPIENEGARIYEIS